MDPLDALPTSQPECLAHPPAAVEAAESLLLLRALIPILLFILALPYLITETPTPPKRTLANYPPAPPSPPYGWGGETEPIFFTDDLPTDTHTGL